MPLKTMALTALVCLCSWVVMDGVQTRELEAIVRQHLMQRLNQHAERDRIQLDRFFRSQAQAAGLLVRFAPLLEHASNLPITPGVEQPNRHTRLPPWLPRRALLRHLVHAGDVALYDNAWHLREFVSENDGDALPEEFLTGELPRLLAVGEADHIIGVGGRPVLVTSAAVPNPRGEAPLARLVLLAPLDDRFLTAFQDHTRSEGILLLLSDGGMVLASSRPELVPNGIPAETLADRYLTVGKEFFDYGFYTDLRVQIASLIPHRQLADLTDSILMADRTHRLISFSVFSLFFLLVITWVSLSIEGFTRRMVAAARRQLGLDTGQMPRGDQLFVLESQFQLLIEALAAARTAERDQNAQFRETNIALEQSLTMIKRTQEKLINSEKMAALGNLVAGVAHEINTPVGIGVTAASLLDQQARDTMVRYAAKTLRGSDLTRFLETAMESSGIILSNLRRAADLIRSFKQVAVDQSSEEMRRFRLRSCIDDVLLSLNPTLRKSPHRVIVHCAETVELDSLPGAIAQILTNLVMNALLHGLHDDTPGEITIDAREHGDRVILRFADNGCGIAPDHLPMVFDPFFTTRRGQGGSGLGLFVVYNLITHTLGGAIEVSSTPGQGTVFDLHIPLRRAMDDD